MAADTLLICALFNGDIYARIRNAIQQWIGNTLPFADFDQCFLIVIEHGLKTDVIFAKCTWCVAKLAELRPTRVSANY